MPEALTGSVPAETIADVERAFTSLGRAILNLKNTRRYHTRAEELDRTSYFALVLLEDLGPMRVCELAGWMGLDASTVSRALKQLTDDDLVARTRDASDKRAQVVHVSPKGRAVVSEASTARRKMLGAAMSGWDGDDCRTLGELMSRLSDALRSSDDLPRRENP